MADLLAVMSKLRSPQGCPWDREQDHRTLRYHAVEEVYELIDAIEADDDQEMAEELGDLLLQVVFHCQLAAERGAFDFEPLLKMERGIDDPFVYKERHYVDSMKDRDAKYSEISVLKRAGNIKIPIFITNNIVNRNSFDITTIRVQTFELSHALSGDVPKVVFGDLHLHDYESAFVDVVGRAEGIEEFLAKYLAPPVTPAGH